MSEAKITKKVTTLLDSFISEDEPLYYNKISDRFTSGIPDLSGVYWGISFYIELKDIGKKARLLQEWHLGKAQDAGAMVLSTDNFEEVVEFMKSIRTYSNLGGLSRNLLS